MVWRKGSDAVAPREAEEMIRNHPFDPAPENASPIPAFGTLACEGLVLTAPFPWEEQPRLADAIPCKAPLRGPSENCASLVHFPPPAETIGLRVRRELRAVDARPATDLGGR